MSINRNEQLVIAWNDACANGTNLYNIGWDWDLDEQTKTVNLDKPWFVVEYNMSENVRNLHAHIASCSTDCDGTYDRTHVTWLHELHNSDNLDEWEFQGRIMRSEIEMHNPYATMSVTECGFDTWAPNDEGGGRSSSVQFCYDWSCVDEKDTYRDHTAERAGY